jgi:hypothetical protein
VISFVLPRPVLTIARNVAVGGVLFKVVRKKINEELWSKIFEK